MKRGILSLMVIVVLSALAVAQKPPKKYGDLKIKVVKKHNKKPVQNASVVLHLINAKGEQQKGGYQLKTASDGTISFDSAPYGKLRVQVIATGFQTFGQDIDINQPLHELLIELNRPKEQYSIYEKKPEEKKKQ